MKQRRKTLVLSLLVALAVGIAVYRQNTNDPPGGNTSDSETEITPKTEYTEEEKAFVESQTGVTVREDGTMNIDIGEILAEEGSVTINREDAQNRALESAGEGSEIVSADLRPYEGEQYWVVRTAKGEEVYQIWLNAETGEELINQKE